LADDSDPIAVHQNIANCNFPSMCSKTTADYDSPHDMSVSLDLTSSFNVPNQYTCVNDGVLNAFFEAAGGE
jgi:hypothetical protein